ncbi:MAG: hypothetical protein K8T25_01950 [Planctomycetia bacterium]|nr:hypothetical protein [Planctomycetia bacterium]
MKKSSKKSNSERVLLDALNLLCHHVVSLNWYEGPTDASGIPTKRPAFYGVSGFVIESKGKWYLATVGHLFSEIAGRMLVDPDRRIIQPSILDFWGDGAIDNHRVPFDFLAARHFFIHDFDKGLDFALIELPGNTRDLLASNKRLPFHKKDWLPSNMARIDFLILVGFADCDLRTLVGGDGKDEEISNEPVPSMIHLEFVSDDDVPDELRKPNPRLYGKLSPRADLPTPKGMSGGPVFGFGVDHDGQSRYWPVAMQSGWYRPARVVAASPLFQYADDIDRF